MKQSDTGDILEADVDPPPTRGRQVLEKLVFGLLTSSVGTFVLSYIAFYGFKTNYTYNVFSEAGVRSQYEQGVFRYRVAGRKLLLWLTRILSQAQASQRIPIFRRIPIHTIDRLGNADCYLSYFTLNWVWLSLFSLANYWLMGRRDMVREEVTRARTLWVVFLNLLVTSTWFVVTFYDTPLYFFLSLSTFFIVRDGKWDSLLLALFIGAATLFRESSALIVSTYASVLMARHGRRFLAKWHKLGLAGSAYLATYVMLRIIYGFAGGAVREFHWPRLDHLLLFVGFMIGAGVVAMGSSLWRSEPGRKFVLWYAVWTAPYAVIVLGSGVLLELRLLLPVALPLFLVSCMRPSCLADQRC